jgi:hypothetical protein
VVTVAHVAEAMHLSAQDCKDIEIRASGAPVLDCKGQVVAVVSNLLTRSMQFLSRVVRISTPWEEPNVISVPIQALKDFATAE